MTQFMEHWVQDPPMLPDEYEQGFRLAYIDNDDGTTTWLVDRFDGEQSPVSEDEAIRLVLSPACHTTSRNQPPEMRHIMPAKTGNPMDEAVEEATGILQKYMEPTISFISTKKPGANPTAGQIDREGQLWIDLARHFTFTGFRGRVCLDTVDGSFSRPDTDQIVFIALPINHPMFHKGHCEVVAMLYHPTETYVDRKTGEIKASNFDPTGWMGKVAQFGSYAAAKSELIELQAAVRAAASGTNGDRMDRSDEYKDDLPDDQKIAHGTTLEDWGF